MVAADTREVRDQQLRRSAGLELGDDLGRDTLLLSAGSGKMMRQFVQCTSVQNRLGSPAFTAASASRVSSCSDPNPGTTIALGHRQRRAPRRAAGDALNQRGVLRRGEAWGAGLEARETLELDHGPTQHEAPAGVEVGLALVVDPAVVAKRERVRPERQGRARMRTPRPRARAGAREHRGADSTLPGYAAPPSTDRTCPVM